MTREEREAAHLAQLQAEDDADAAERHRREHEPTDEERILDRLDAILCSGAGNEQVEELARILKWHITGSEY